MDILIDKVDGRLANQLYPIMVGLSYYELNKHIFNRIIFNNSDTFTFGLIFTDDILCAFPKLKDKVIFDANEYERAMKENNFIDYHQIELKTYDNFNHNLYINGYCQNAKKINEDLIREYLAPTKEYIDEIDRLYGNVSNKTSIHIRRADYLDEGNNLLYYVFNENYIKHIIDKYCPYPNEFICLSDDIKWCKDNLNFIDNIIFVDKKNNETKLNPILIDFFIPMLVNRNIVSPSSFCVLSATLNKNAIINTPYYKIDDLNNDVDLQITKDWMILEDIKPFAN